MSNYSRWLLQLLRFLFSNDPGAAAAACAAAAAFLLAIQRKDKTGTAGNRPQQNCGVIEFASGLCVCKVQHVEWRRATQP